MRGASALLLVAIGITLLYLAATNKIGCLSTAWKCMSAAGGGGGGEGRSSAG